MGPVRSLGPPEVEGDQTAFFELLLRGLQVLTHTQPGVGVVVGAVDAHDVHTRHQQPPR